MSTAFLGLGSNLGDRVGNLVTALRELASDPRLKVERASHAYETEPWGVVDQPAFVNAVARVAFDGSAEELLQLIKDVEDRMGRTVGERFGPRLIDIDILLFDGEQRATPALVLPHPRLLERDFVVTPLISIDPSVTLPDGSPLDARDANEGRVLSDLGPLPGFRE